MLSKFKDFCKKTSIENNTEIKILELDLSNSESVKNCYQNILKEKKNIDILINNAGMVHNSLLHMTTEKEFLYHQLQQKELMKEDLFTHQVKQPYIQPLEHCQKNLEIFLSK